MQTHYPKECIKLSVRIATKQKKKMPKQQEPNGKCISVDMRSCPEFTRTDRWWMLSRWSRHSGNTFLATLRTNFSRIVLRVVVLVLVHSTSYSKMNNTTEAIVVAVKEIKQFFGLHAIMGLWSLSQDSHVLEFKL